VAVNTTAMAEIENCHLGEAVTYYHDMGGGGGQRPLKFFFFFFFLK